MAPLYAFKNFNNYYDRKLKKYENLQDYPEPAFMETDTYCNFNPNDGINTSIVFGRPGFNNYPGDCDYLIYSADNINITSRWFIIEQQRKLVDQYQVTLHRDILADNWDKILNSDCFIEKAILPDSNPLVYNQEDMSVNQIKTSETLLKDATNCPWIVAYYDKSSTISGTVAPKYNYDIAVESASGWASSNASKYLPQDVDDISFFAYYNTPMSGNIRQKINLNTGANSTQSNSSNLVCFQSEATVNTGAFNKAAMLTNFNTDTSNKYKSNGEIEAFIATYNGAVLYQNALGNEAYYRITITSTAYATATEAITSGNLNYSYIENKRVDNTTLAGTPNEDSYKAEVKYKTLSISLTPLYENETISYGVNNSCYDLQDAPYRMLCMPYGDITEIFNDVEYTSNKELNFQIAMAMQDDGSKVFDIQIVPFCPLNDQFITEDGEIDAGNDNLLAHPITKANNDILGYIYSCSQSSFKRHIEFNKTISNPKIENQCDMYRLCSPNYAGVFEFSAAKNKGILGFDISCTYKPYQPYIHLNPDFQGLYGTDFGDNRGLICGGDFSLAKITDAFTEYQLNNKNFQNVFDREIQNMEVNHKYDMLQSKFSAVTGAVGSGATMGMLTGNVGVGLAAGAVSLAGGLADVSIKQSLYNEALDYKRDLFGYQLDNIKAQPQSLSRTTAYNNDNKYFPFIEYYTCTDEEKRAFANKIAWNSMTVSVIDKIQNYINNSWSYGDITDKGYIKAKLIRFEDSNEDFHNLNTIAEELDKGVYTK